VNEPAVLRSALYEGTVTHVRTDPAHRFTVPVSVPLLHLDELAALGRLHPLAALDPAVARRPAGLRVLRDDFLPGPEATLREAVAGTLAAAGVEDTGGPVALLGFVRTWGWLFNPLTLYYCFDASGREVERTVLEVTNTPWHERCRYVAGPPGRDQTMAKAMHVSPFLPATGTYTLSYSAPGDALTVALAVTSPDDERTAVRATMSLRRRPLDRAALAGLLWRRPLQTRGVSARIYGHAARLRAKGAVVHRNPGYHDTVVPTNEVVPADR
jgi:DUF1365 family protein